MICRHRRLLEVLETAAGQIIAILSLIRDPFRDILADAHLLKCKKLGIQLPVIHETFIWIHWSLPQGVAR